MAEYKDPETLQRMRVVAQMKFKRKVKCLQLQIDKDSTPENLHRCYDEVNKAYEELEQAHESYLEQICLTADLESEEIFMDDADSLKINVTNSYDKALTKCNQDREADVKKFKLLPEDSQCSSWEIINTVGGNEKQTISLDCHQVREDLKIMFPYLDADDIEEALQDRHGDINETIDRLLTTTIETNIQDNGSKKNINMNHLQECSICCEVYNEDDHRPLVLPCGHTLCKACINNVTSEGWNTVTIHCPICRKYHTINPNQLTTNYIVLDLLQATGNSAQQNNERSTSFSPESKVKYSKSEENHKVEVEQDTKRYSSNHKVEIEQETKRNCTTKPDGKSNARSSILKSVGIGVGVVAGGAAAIAAAPVVLTGVGFTSAGIAAGSWAASMMSAAAVANGGAIAAGSTIGLTLWQWWLVVVCCVLHYMRLPQSFEEYTLQFVRRYQMGGAKAAQQVFTHTQRVRILYKTILKLHRGFPLELQALGDQYAKDEFRRHKDASPEQTQTFMQEWTNYAITIAKQLGIRGTHQSKSIGKSFNENDLEDFNVEQIYQLFELHETATKPELGQTQENKNLQ